MPAAHRDIWTSFVFIIVRTQTHTDHRLEHGSAPRGCILTDMARRPGGLVLLAGSHPWTTKLG